MSRRFAASAAFVTALTSMAGSSSCGELLGVEADDPVDASADQHAGEIVLIDGGAIAAPDASEGDAAARLPDSCIAAHARGVRETDGDVEVDIDGAGPLKPFTVFCKDMGSAPKEYLALANTTDPTSAGAFDSGKNVSGWAMGPGGGSTSCLCAPNVVRAFTRVRLRLSSGTVKIDLADLTFSTTNRANDVPTECEQSKPSCQAFGGPGSRYGVASTCIEQSLPIGRGSVDLRGTPFHIGATESGHHEGFAAVGSTTYFEEGGLRKQAETLGGGSCGHEFPGASAVELAIELD